MIRKLLAIMAFSVAAFVAGAQNQAYYEIQPSVNSEAAANLGDGKMGTYWALSAEDLKTEQDVVFKMMKSGDLRELRLAVTGVKSDEQFRKLFDFQFTYDPQNPGKCLDYTIARKGKERILSFKSQYGSYLRMIVRAGESSSEIRISEVIARYTQKDSGKHAVGEVMQWFSHYLSIDERIDKLMASMTVADKMEVIREGRGVQGVEHLGIPYLSKTEAIHGVQEFSGTTMFPQVIGLSTTWDRDMIYRVGQAIGEEMVDANFTFCWSPVLDVARDPRWGRCEETYGEDPVLVASLGGKWIEGVESQGVYTTPKHFAVHGAPEGGRDSNDIGLSEREIREIHLVPFRHAFRDLGVQSTMMAYSDYMGVPVAKSYELLVNILREEWGFDGFIVSDCGAIHNSVRKHYVAKDKVEAAANALAVGIATNCGSVYNDQQVINAAKEGKFNMRDLDNTCRDVLRVILRNGLLEENPTMHMGEKKESTRINSPEHRAVALEAAQKSIVMLKNEGNVLPLAKNVSKIAVVGPAADDLQFGDYSIKLVPGTYKTILDGIKEKVSAGTEVIYEKGCDFNGEIYVNIDKAVEAASKADMVVIALGDYSNNNSNAFAKDATPDKIDKTCGEHRDAATQLLQGKQEELLKAVCETGKPVVAIYQIGRPYNLTYASEHADAILVNWLPGQEGGQAAADVLFGDYNPAGRLSMTFPRSAAQLPLYYNFKTSGRIYDYLDMPGSPLYRFGYGLSYTQFEYSDIQVSEKENGHIGVSANVTNVGKLAGDEVAQLYITDMFASVKTRIMELKDFERIHLEPGETRTVSFDLEPYEISVLNESLTRVVEPGEFKIYVGGASPVYNFGDKIKDSVRYESAKDGVYTTYHQAKAYAADFVFSEAVRNNNGSVSVKVGNRGNLNDFGKIALYVDGVRIGHCKHFELDPGQSKVLVFDEKKIDPASEVMFVGEDICITLE